MEKMTIYFKDGNLIELNENSLTTLTNDNLTVTTKASSEDDDGNPVVVTTTQFYSLGTIDRLVKINKTVKFDFEDVSTK